LRQGVATVATGCCNCRDRVLRLSQQGVAPIVTGCCDCHDRVLQENSH